MSDKDKTPSDNVTLLPTPSKQPSSKTANYQVTYDNGGLGDPAEITVEGYLVLNAMMVTILSSDDLDNADVLFTVPMSRLVSVEKLDR